MSAPERIWAGKRGVAHREIDTSDSSFCEYVRRDIAERENAELRADLRRITEEHARIIEINKAHCKSVNTYIVSSARLEDRATEAEARAEDLSRQLAKQDAKLARVRAEASEVGNMIHNLSCRHQHNEDLSEALGELRSRLWALARAALASVKERAMDAREIIAECACRPDRNKFDVADYTIRRLRAAGYQIIHRDENHGPTLKRAAAVASCAIGREFGPEPYQRLMATPGEIAAAIRAMGGKNDG